MANKIVVLHILEDLFSKGGTPRKLLSLVENSDKNRFLHVLLLYNNCKDNLNDGFTKSGAIVIEKYRRRNYDIRFFFDIVREAKKYNADILNTHFARSDIYGALAGMFCKKPVIKSVHGVVWNKSRLLIYIDRMVSPLRYVTTCNSSASLQAEVKRSRSNKAKIIYNGVVPRRSHSEFISFKHDLGIPSDSFVVGHVGGFIDSRHQELIIDAIAILNQNDIEVYGIFAGDGPRKDFLIKRVRDHKLEGKVLFLDYVEDVGRFLIDIDVFVNMASAEGFGIAIVEAMFAGLPVVLSNAGSHPELIIHNESGILVAEGSSRLLANALLRLKSDYSLRLKIGNGAKMRSMEKFSIDRFVSDFEKLYFECKNSLVKP